jgi:hypothetical protein
MAGAILMFLKSSRKKIPHPPEIGFAYFPLEEISGQEV